MTGVRQSWPIVTRAWANWRGEIGFRVGLHNHLGPDRREASENRAHPGQSRSQAAVSSRPIPRTCTWLAPTSSRCSRSIKHRLIFADYKDAKWTTPDADFVEDNGKVQPKDSEDAKFLSSIYDLGDGEIDFPACHRVLKSVGLQRLALRGPRHRAQRPARQLRALRRVHREQARADLS